MMVLDLVKSDKNEWLNEVVKEIDLGNNSIKERFIKEIDVHLIVGTTRCGGGLTWKEYIENFFHKNYFFNSPWNEDKEEAIFNTPQNNDYPNVVEKDGEYYIGEDGLPRIIIAKCIKRNKIRALVMRTEVI